MLPTTFAAQTTTSNIKSTAGESNTTAPQPRNTRRQTYRDVFTEAGQNRLPRVTPHNDFEILLLATCGEFTEDDNGAFAKFAETYLERTLSSLLRTTPREERLVKYMSALKELFDKPAVVIGVRDLISTSTLLVQGLTAVLALSDETFAWR